MRLLDTGIVIESIRENRLEPEAISVITLMEFLRGVDSSKRTGVKTLLEEVYSIEPFDNAVILEYCTLFNVMKDAGQHVPDANLIIAATAMARNYELISSDQHFDRLREHGLKFKTRM